MAHLSAVQLSVLIQSGYRASGQCAAGGLTDEIFGDSTSICPVRKGKNKRYRTKREAEAILTITQA